MPAKIEIDPSVCIVCEACVRVCPANVFVSTSSDLPPDVAQPLRCIACGHCVAVCPVEAVHHSRFTSASLFPADDIQNPDAQSILNWMQTRRSVRGFTREPVRKDYLQLILKAARSAPVASNRPTTRYTVVQDPVKIGQISELTVFHLANQATLVRNRFLRTVARIFKPELVKMGIAYLPVLDEMVEKLKQGGDPILHHAPVLLLLHGPKRSSFANENAQLSVQNAALMCHTLGLGNFYTGFVVIASRSNHAIARLVDISDRETIYAGLAIGVPADSFVRGIRRDDPPINWN